MFEAHWRKNLILLPSTFIHSIRILGLLGLVMWICPEAIRDTVCSYFPPSIIFKLILYRAFRTLALCCSEATWILTKSPNFENSFRIGRFAPSRCVLCVRASHFFLIDNASGTFRPLVALFRIKKKDESTINKIRLQVCNQIFSIFHGKKYSEIFKKNGRIRFKTKKRSTCLEINISKLTHVG